MFVRIHYKNGVEREIKNVISIINNDQRNEIVYVREGREPIVKIKSDIKMVSVFEEKE